MIITDAQYIQDNEGNNAVVNCVINGIHCSVPMDEDNYHYRAILEWAEEDGNEIQAAE